MMMPEEEEESIYNLLPKPSLQVDRPRMYKSRHNPKLAPSYSTFGTQGTGKLQANCHGDDELGAKGALSATATMGSVGNYPDASRFLKKRGGVKLPAVPKTRTPRVSNKAPVPKRSEKPVMGLVTEKNFIIANAVDSIMMAPKRPAKSPENMTQKKEYGKPPSYLSRVKKEIAREYEYMDRLQDRGHQSDSRMREMTDEEKEELTSRMKEKWAATHQQYLSLTFSLDTISKVQRKEAIEAELEQLEKAISKLSKKVIYVYDDTM